MGYLYPNDKLLLYGGRIADSVKMAGVWLSQKGAEKPIDRRYKK